MKKGTIDLDNQQEIKGCPSKHGFIIIDLDIVMVSPRFMSEVSQDSHTLCFFPRGLESDVPQWFLINPQH